ncbi:hypothetical protein [Massilia sp. PWRC2]|uniref:hypothetical protein n=1 Tax=Massilia sp. PWRC2 TaxID=2804626 RepID=UPI003CF67B50
MHGHGHGDGKGQAVLVQPVEEGSSTMPVIGGAGGKLNYMKGVYAGTPKIPRVRFAAIFGGRKTCSGQFPLTRSSRQGIRTRFGRGREVRNEAKSTMTEKSGVPAYNPRVKAFPHADRSYRIKLAYLFLGIIQLDEFAAGHPVYGVVTTPKTQRLNDLSR